MFRTCNLRGKQRFDKMRNQQEKKQAKISLTRQQIQTIEQSPALHIAEKIDLLLVAAGMKLTTELYLNIQYGNNTRTKTLTPCNHTLSKIQHVLERLPFDYFLDTIPKINPSKKRKQNFVWFQVSVNSAVTYFMKNFSDDMTEFEEGVLYGYPLSAIRAFSGLIDIADTTTFHKKHFLAGVSSREFIEDEWLFYSKWWKEVQDLSPSLATQAQSQYPRLGFL